MSEALRAAQERYRKSVKGRAAAQRARDKYNGVDAARARVRAAYRESERRENRRDRIRRGLPPDVPASAPRVRVPGGQGFRAAFVIEEIATAERLRPEYIAAALAVEDLL